MNDGNKKIMHVQNMLRAVNLYANKYSMIIILLFIMGLFQWMTNGILLKPLNITNLILQNSYILVLAVGMLLCILTGGNIDLSVGSVAAFVGAVTAVLVITLGWPPLLVFVAALVIGAAIGAWQGFWIAVFRIPAFIVTLAGMLIFRGLTLVILQGRTLAPFPDQYQKFGFIGYIPDVAPQGLFGMHMLSILIGLATSALIILAQLRSRKEMRKYGFSDMSRTAFIFKLIGILIAINFLCIWLARYRGIPIMLFLLAFLYFAYSFMTQQTVTGRHIYAFGGNEKAARLSGVKTTRILFGVYVNMGMLAALAGIIFSVRLNAATPKAGTLFELDAIAACFIGGASALGGVGTVAGAIIGGLIMGILNNGMSIMGVSIDWQQTVKGLVLLFAVILDMYSKNKNSRGI